MAPAEIARIRSRRAAMRVDIPLLLNPILVSIFRV